ncbi:lipoprotein [Salmonella enterica subsp. enterica]|uniref:Lipoprotein n=1 Tax=Salmonella enterica I TaxID=59201 RepID=A0A379WPY4_SALET|nr:lipoprotein [Salmonella enterica subsp. enterica]
MKIAAFDFTRTAAGADGCSTLSSVNWSAANPWNWFGSSTEVTEQGVER